MPVSPGRALSRRTGCCPGLRMHPAPHSDTCNLLPDPTCPEHAREHRNPAQPSEGQKTILLLCQALGKLPPPPMHPVLRFVSGLGIPGTSARLPRPTAHLRVRTCSAGCAPVPPARRWPHGAHPRLQQAPPRAPPAFPARQGWKKQLALPSITREPKCFVPGQSPWVNK